MDSFGLWYKVDEKNRINKADFEMHINLWSKLNNKTYLDIGIKIFNYKDIDELIFLCPFKLKNDEIIDLSDKISRKENVDLILNNDADIETKDNYVVIKDHEKRCDYLIFPFRQAVQGVQKIEQIDESHSKIIINFRDFKQYIKDLKKTQDSEECSCNLDGIDNLYIRFRIKSEEMDNILFKDIEPANKFLQSGFVSTQVIDFKMNNIRNISPTIRATASRYKEDLVEFKCIHFLLMEPAESNIEYMSNQMTCRKLEDRVWNDYLDISWDEDLSILVYHSKEVAKECDLTDVKIKNDINVVNQDVNEKQINSSDKKIKEFNQLVKISYSKTNKKIILKYAFYAILLGAISGLVANIIWALPGWINS